MAKEKVQKKEIKKNKIPCLTAAANVLKPDTSSSLFFRR